MGVMVVLGSLICIALIFKSGSAKEFYIASVWHAPFGYDACVIACVDAARGGTLVSCIEREEYYPLIKRLGFRSVVVGLRQLPGGQEPYQGWIWPTCNVNQEMFIPWGPSEPNDDGGREDCAAILMNHCGIEGEMADIPCRRDEGHVTSWFPRDCLCQIDGEAPRDTDHGEVPEIPDSCSTNAEGDAAGAFGFLILICCCLGGFGTCCGVALCMAMKCCCFQPSHSPQSAGATVIGQPTQGSYTVVGPPAQTTAVPVMATAVPVIATAVPVMATVVAVPVIATAVPEAPDDNQQ